GQIGGDDVMPLVILQTTGHVGHQGGISADVKDELPACVHRHRRAVVEGVAQFVAGEPIDAQRIGGTGAGLIELQLLGLQPRGGLGGCRHDAGIGDELRQRPRIAELILNRLDG
ncbi:MAG: hypothetical protein ACK56F_12510, partial [bacterium]